MIASPPDKIASDNFGLSVVLPTLNCMSMLPDHLRSMRPWLDLAREIIVVDSNSTDGTAEYIRAELGRSYPVAIHLYERGLYQSWNYAIQQATSDWIYISTVGDSITRELLHHLYRVAIAGRCDVVLGSPAFIDRDGQPQPPLDWAVTEIATTLAQSSPCLLDHDAAIFYALRHLYTSALLGSAASNLHRTAHLKTHPFPVDFGRVGDAAWGLLYAFETRFGCTSFAGSTFRLHEKTYSLDAYQVDGIAKKLAATGLATLRRHANHNALNGLRTHEMTEMLIRSLKLTLRVKELRRTSRAPWYFYPHIWRARAHARRSRGEFLALVSSAKDLIRRQHCSPIALY
jgi:hypothetical protein